MFLVHRSSLSQELKKAPTPPAQQPPLPAAPAPPQPQVKHHQCDTPHHHESVDCDPWWWKWLTLLTNMGLHMGHDNQLTSLDFCLHQMLRRGKANGTLRSQWPWPNQPSSLLPQRCPLLSLWQPLPPAPRQRSSLRWAPSWRRPSSEEARVQMMRYEAGSAIIIIIIIYLRGYREGTNKPMDSFKTHPWVPFRHARLKDCLHFSGISTVEGSLLSICKMSTNLTLVKRDSF